MRSAAPKAGTTRCIRQLGTFEDFRRLVAAAREHGLEIAHRLRDPVLARPSVAEASIPNGSTWRPDGTIKYAENPPKKYEDIVNVDFYAPGAMPGLWEALRDVVLFWIGHGVKIFRVDNPHTKPLPFWQWMIADVRARHPDAIFLSEAFTRPEDDVPAGEGRLLAVLHLLHLAQHQAGAHRVPDRAHAPPSRPTSSARTSSSTRPTSIRSSCRARAAPAS